MNKSDLDVWLMWKTGLIESYKPHPFLSEDFVIDNVNSDQEVISSQFASLNGGEYDDEITEIDSCKLENGEVEP